MVRVWRSILIMFLGGPRVVGEKEAASSEECLFKVFFLNVATPSLDFADSSPHSRPSFDLGHRYRQAPLMGPSLHPANKSRSRNLSIISIHSPSSPRLPPPKRRHRPSSFSYGAGLGVLFQTFPALARWAAWNVRVRRRLAQQGSLRARAVSSAGEARRHPEPRVRSRVSLRRVTCGVA